MFANVPVFKASDSTSETHIIQPALIRDIAPHDNVTVSGTDTPCVEVFFAIDHSIIVLIDMASFISQLQAMTGVFDNYGSLL